MENTLTAKIGADISGFQGKMKEMEHITTTSTAAMTRGMDAVGVHGLKVSSAIASINKEAREFQRLAATWDKSATFAGPLMGIGKVGNTNVYRDLAANEVKQQQAAAKAEASKIMDIYNAAGKMYIPPVIKTPEWKAATVTIEEQRKAILATGDALRKEYALQGRTINEPYIHNRPADAAASKPQLLLTATAAALAFGNKSLLEDHATNLKTIGKETEKVAVATKALAAANDVTKASTDSLNQKIAEGTNTLSKYETFLNSWASSQVRRAKEQGIETLEEFDKLLAPTKGHVKDKELAAMDQASRQLFIKTMGNVQKDWKLDFISQSIREATVAGVKDIATMKQRLMQAAGGKWTGLEDRTLLAFGASIGVTGKAYGAALDGMAKKSVEVAPKMTGLFGMIRDEIATTVQFASYRIPVIGRMLGSLAGSAISGGGVLGGGGGGGGGPPPSAFAGVGKGALLFTALATAAEVAAFAIGTKFAGQLAYSNESLEDMARVVNISALALSGLEHAAIMEGESLQGLQRTFIMLNDRIQDAASNSNSAAAKMFDAWGIKLIDPLTKKVKPFLTILFELSDEMKRLGDTSERTSQVKDLVGAFGMGNFIKIFGEGSEVLKEHMNQVDKTGTAYDEFTGKASERYRKAVRGMSEQWRGLKVAMGKETQDTMAAAFDVIAEGIKKIKYWASGDLGRDFRDSIGRTLEGYFKFTDEALKKRTGKGTSSEVSASQKAIVNMLKKEVSDSAGLAGANVGLLTDRLKELGSPVKENTGAAEKWKDMIESTNDSLQSQISSLDEQTIAMKRGEMAAKEYSLINAMDLDIAKARKAGAPASVIASITKLWNAGIPIILAQTKAQMDLRIEMQKVDDVAKMLSQDSGEWLNAASEVGAASLKLAESMEDVRTRTLALSDGTRNLEDRFSDMAGTMKPGERALRDYERGLHDLELQIRSLIVTTQKEINLGGAGVEGAEQRLTELKALLDKITASAANPKQSMTDALKNSLTTGLDEAYRVAEEKGRIFGGSFDIIGEKLNALTANINSYIDASKEVPQHLREQFEQLTFFKDFRDGALQIFDSIGSALTSTLEGVIQGTQTLGEGMKNMARNIAISILDTVTQVFIINPIKKWFTNMLDSVIEAMNTASSGGGIWAQIFGFIGSVAGAFAGGGGGAANAASSSAPLAGVTTFTARGGIVPQKDYFPVKGFSAGGIVNKPMFGFIGENAPNDLEAVVPLPDNRSIPVKFMGGGGGGYDRGSSSPSQTSVHVQFLGDMVKPEKPTKPEDMIKVWVEDYTNSGPTRSIMRRDPANVTT